MIFCQIYGNIYVHDQNTKTESLLHFAFQDVVFTNLSLQIYLLIFIILLSFILSSICLFHFILSSIVLRKTEQFL